MNVFSFQYHFTICFRPQLVPRCQLPRMRKKNYILFSLKALICACSADDEVKKMSFTPGNVDRHMYMFQILHCIPAYCWQGAVQLDINGHTKAQPGHIHVTRICFTIIMFPDRPALFSFYYLFP
jgi:hypothetical protein